MLFDFGKGSAIVKPFKTKAIILFKKSRKSFHQANQGSARISLFFLEKSYPVCYI
jgi:hypothetical protein